MNATKAWKILKETATDWVDDGASRLAASLAFYTLLSIAPLLVLVVAIAGVVFGEEAARGEVAGQLRQVMGAQAGEGVQTLLASARSPGKGVLATAMSLTMLFIGASGVFGELQESLNTIWEVTPKPGRGILDVIKDRFFSFTMVLGVAFLLLVSLVITTVLAVVGAHLALSSPGLSALWQTINFVASLAGVTVLFALMFKVIPDVHIAWKNVWVGALATSFLFTIGKWLLGLYLGHAAVGSAYGAAGSIVVLVVWVYYSAQIFFLGAEFTQVHARVTGSKLEPTPKAMPLKSKASTSATPSPRTDGACGDVQH